MSPLAALHREKGRFKSNFGSKFSQNNMADSSAETVQRADHQLQSLVSA
jgi:hypothetical protein